MPQLAAAEHIEATWNNLSEEDKYAQGLGDETYQLLQTTISETSRWQEEIEIYGDPDESASSIYR